MSLKSQIPGINIFFSQKLHLILVLYILFFGFISCHQFFIMWHFLIHSYDNSLSCLDYFSSILFKKNTWVIYFLRCCESEHIFLFCNFLPGNTVIESQHFSLKNSAGTAQHYLTFSVAEENEDSLDFYSFTCNLLFSLPRCVFVFVCFLNIWQESVSSWLPLRNIV